jgi:cobalt-zinc-cadmium efflux system membrane fusion protein
VHLRVGQARRTSWPVTIRTTGTADFDGDHTAQVITQVSGPITRIAVDLGARVKAGDPLLFVSSADFANAVSAYRKAQNRLDLARLTLERNRDLLDHRVISQKDFETSQADFNDASTDVQNSLDDLRIFGVTDKEIGDARRQNGAIRADLAVRSPIGGLVVQKLVLPGQVIQAGATTCFLVSDPSTMWIQAHVHEQEVADVRAGCAAEVSGGSTAGVFTGKVSYVGAMLDAATRTIPVRIVTANRGDLLKKDQFVDVVIHAGTRRAVLAVPTAAVLYNNENFPFVYLQVGPGRFAQRQVTLGAAQDGESEVLSGIGEGDTIVTDGSVFLQFAQASGR